MSLVTLLSLLQVLLSGLIGVVSWKRPLSLVVSGGGTAISCVIQTLYKLTKGFCISNS